MKASFIKYERRETYERYIFTRALLHIYKSNRSEFILVRKGIISIAVKKGLEGGLLSVSISFTVGASRSFENPFPRTARAFSFLPRFTLRSHSIRPSRSVVTARRLYKFYIIFMRHKVVEKPTEERREKKRVRVARERRRGSVLGPNHPSRFPNHPR